MANTVINLRVTVNGALTDLDAPPTFTSTNNFFGIKETTTDTVAVIDQTPMTKKSTGEYTYTFTDVDEAQEYEYSFLTSFENETKTFSGKILPGTTNWNLSVPSVQYFSSETEVIRMLGKFGVELIMEDVGNQAYIWEEVLGYVDETIYQYIAQQYDPELHKTNRFLRRRATILAAHYLSQRRGNPALYLREATQIREEMEALRSGRIHIPNSVPRGNLGPVVRNYVMQPSRHFPQRVQSYKSTGDKYPSEKISYEPYLFIY